MALCHFSRLFFFFVWSLAITMPLLVSADQPAESPADPFLWLEDVAAERSLDWVRARNAESTAELASSDLFGTLEKRILSILDSKHRIPLIHKIGPHFYNFLRDEKNPQGVWRRTTLDDYRSPDPA